MSQHMRMNLERKLRRSARSLDHSQEPSCCYWSASFGHEYIRTVALEWPQGSEFRTVQRMHSLLTALHPIDMQATMPEIDLRPAERAKLFSPQSMPVGQQDRRCIPRAIPSPSLGRFNQPIN